MFLIFDNKPENLILYHADKTAGMSSSPVWMKDKYGKHHLAAIHINFLDFIDKKSRKK